MTHPRWGFLGLAVALALSLGVGAASALVWQTNDDGVYRFFPDGVSPDGYVGSSALLVPCQRVSMGQGASGNLSAHYDQDNDECEMREWSTEDGPCPATTIPAFSDFNDREIVLLPVAPGTSLYGLGEAGGPLLRNGTIVECWNSDIYGYAVGSSPLYQSHPWVLGVRSDGTAFGVIVDTSSRCTFALTTGIRWQDGVKEEVGMIAVHIGRFCILKGLVSHHIFFLRIEGDAGDLQKFVVGRNHHRWRGGQRGCGRKRGDKSRFTGGLIRRRNGRQCSGFGRGRGS